MSRLLTVRTLERLATLDLWARNASGGGGIGERPSGMAGVGTIFHEHRTYTPGDDVRYVDWNAYARLRSLQVKVYELEENLDVHLIVDRTASMGQGVTSKLHTGCRLAAMVGTTSLARGDTVRLTFLPSDPSVEFRPFRGRAATRQLLAALENVQGDVKAPLGDALQKTFPRQRRRGFALLVTDFLDTPDAQRPDWRQAVDFLAYRRVELTCLHMVAHEERYPWLDGPVRLRDAESGEMVSVDVDKNVRDEYVRRFELWLREVGAYLATKEARHTVMDCGVTDEAELLRRMLHGRVLR